MDRPPDLPTPPPGRGGPAPSTPAEEDAHYRAYWRRNLRIMGVLLAIWFVVSYGFGILLVDLLDRIRIPGTGFRLGFWFAQQGSIYVFVALIFVYVVRMNRLDREFGVQEDEPARPGRGRGARGSGGPRARGAPPAAEGRS